MHTLLSQRSYSKRSRWAGAAVAAATLMLAACAPSDIGKAKLKAIPEGSKREAVVGAMGTGPLAPTTVADEPRIVNGFRHQVYITAGQQFEIIWYREAPGMLSDPITRETDTPVVIQGDSLAGWGWKFFTPFAAKLNLPDPSHDKARVDSIAKSQIPK